MPEPMSAEEFIEHLQKGHPNMVDWHHIGDKYTNEELVDETKRLIASTLRAAADRFCDKCMDCTAEEVGDEKPTCRKLRPILAPLDKTDKGE